MNSDRIELTNNQKTAIVFEQDLQIMPKAFVVHYEFDDSVGFGSLILDVASYDGENYQGVGYCPPQFLVWVLTDKKDNILNATPYKDIKKTEYYRLHSNLDALIDDVQGYIANIDMFLEPDGSIGI